MWGVGAGARAGAAAGAAMNIIGRDRAAKKQGIYIQVHQQTKTRTSKQKPLAYGQHITRDTQQSRPTGLGQKKTTQKTNQKI